MNKQHKIRAFFTPSVMTALLILLVVIGGAVLADWLAPYDPNAISLGEALQGPSVSHILGTDPTGRDIFSRLLFGGRTTLLSALAIVAFAMAFGIPLGLFSGYYGGWFDKITLRVCDIIIAFPSLLLAFVFVAAFGRSLINSIIAIGIIYIPMTAKLTRSLTLTEKTKTYVEAGRTIGYSKPRILFTEILPNCVPSLTAQLTLDIGYAVLDLAAMSFLGLGVQPPTADWGAMLEEGQQLLFLHPLGAVAPGIAIVLTVVAINLLSDGVLRYIDPTQRKLPRLPKQRLEALIQQNKENIYPEAIQKDSTPAKDALLKAEDVHLWLHTAEGLSHILQGAHLEVMPGEIHGLIGESGCGKTMMTKTILNMGDTERMVVRGKISFDGRELTEMAPADRRSLGGRHIGYITQDSLTALNPLFTVGEQIAEMLRYHLGMTDEEAMAEAAKQLERVGIVPGEQMCRRYPHQFSGGQLQRICLAMAVCCGPELLIADEPTTALDVTTQAQILELLRQLQRDGLSILLITHDFGVVSEVCQRISVMEKGEIVEEGETAAIFKHPEMEYTRRLIDSAVRKEGAYE